MLVRKHKEVLNWMMRNLGLDTYGLTWAQFFKGLGLGSRFDLAGDALS